MLSEQEWQELKDLVSKVAPGPWEANCYHLHMDGNGQYRIGVPGKPSGISFYGRHADAEFIAACYRLVPKLLKED